MLSVGPRGGTCPAAVQPSGDVFLGAHRGPYALRGTCSVLAPRNGHNTNMPIPGPRRGTCPADSRAPRDMLSAGHEGWTQGQHAHPRPAPRDMSSGIHALRGTWPMLVPRYGHKANMPIPGPRRGTCPADFQPGKGHAQRWPARRDMSRGRAAFRGCRSSARTEALTRSAGHGQCWFRGMDIRPTCPSLARAEEHVQRNFSPAMDMPIPGPREGTCPADFHPCKGHAQCWPARRDMCSGFPRLQGTCPVFTWAVGHVHWWSRVPRGMSSRA